MSSSFEKSLSSSYLFGSNAPFIEELYEQFLADPNSVPSQWKELFEQYQSEDGAVRDVPHTPIIKAFENLSQHRLPKSQASQGSDKLDKTQIAVLQLISAYRYLGNRQANLDPLKHHPKAAVPELEPSFYGLTEANYNQSYDIGDFKGFSSATVTLRELLDGLHRTYCGTIGTEYMHLSNLEEKRWIEEKLESVLAQPKYSKEDKQHFLERMTAAETLERYLNTRYVGQKRFSLEGGEATIVSMDQIVNVAGQLGTKELVVGMAHRGRLNVLVNVLGKSPQRLFAEFEGQVPTNFAAGDVKYHMGFSSDVGTPGGPMHISLAFNPSHLEIVNPVVAGSVYARQIIEQDNEKEKVLGVLIHGDAAVSGQGVNQEMLNFSQTRGFGTGGIIHIVVNNQIGFTTSDPRDARSSIYCTDIFKMVEAPIFHANGDDPEAVAFVSKLATEFRHKFKKDVVIDIVCYRKLGHNEQDEPMVTQPLMYQIIHKHPGSRQVYADRLIKEGVLQSDVPEQLIEDYRSHLDKGELLYNPILKDYSNKNDSRWDPYLNKEYTDESNTAIPEEKIKYLAQRLTDIPEHFTLHSRVQKVIDDRKKMGTGELPIDWGMAENLAYASLLSEGFPIRLTGEDVGRSTFFHRHAVMHDQNRSKWNEGIYTPLENLEKDQPLFQCYDSVLSENAVLAFEYGYASCNPNELVLWEAQFGDFANGAQVVIDQFISSAEVKWGRSCGLVMMLPHGYEGQGPEHSSARIERYMSLAAQDCMQICYPTTPAQVFHLLRRQMHRQLRKPLIYITPKSMLRHKEAISSMADLTGGQFQTVIPETQALKADKVNRILVCSGKIYYDLIKHRCDNAIENIAIVRLEQLYPFPEKAFSDALKQFPNADEVVWVQEEPRNQGAWYWLVSRQHLAKVTGKRKLKLMSRPASASPAVGYASRHLAQQKDVIEGAFGEIPEIFNI